MSWRPRDEIPAETRDSRLDPYRERAATLKGGGDVEATLFVRVQVYWTQAAGHLWWRRWSEPFEVLHGYMAFTDGRFDDWLVGREEFDEDLGDWSRSKLRYGGELLDVEWLDDTASRHVRDEVFGLGPLDP